MWPGARPFSVVRRGHPLVVRCKPRREMRECIILKKNVANFIIFITTSYFCCCELNQILKRPNSGVFEGMGGVGSFLVEIIPLFNLSHGRKCPFGSLAPPALTLLRRPCLYVPIFCKQTKVDLILIVILI